jgi:CRP/FNR family cyclic AMP-dependent transcriptional regulator
MLGSHRREEAASVDMGAAAGDDTPPSDRIWCLTEADIFRDLSASETAAIAAAAPMKTYAAGAIMYSPRTPVEALFVLKSGRVRIFRVAADGRELPTAILTPGTIFGEMLPTGQHMYDNFAEALDEARAWVMNRADVRRLLLSDPRIAARITEILGSRLAEMATAYKTAPQRIAATLATLAKQRTRSGGPWPRPFSRAAPVALTDDQLAAIVGASRETATEILEEYARRGLIKLANGRIMVLDKAALRRIAGHD